MTWVTRVTWVIWVIWVTIVSRVRERVQISASGHTDADQLGTDFFRFR